jgi:hypothetical protein
MKLKFFVISALCVSSVDTFAASKKLVQRASNDNFCLQVSPSGSPADALCINGSTKTVDLPAGFTINGGTTMNSFVEGTYSPTFSSQSNITTMGSSSWQYQRIGNQVHVFGSVDITPTSANTITSFVMTVPITATSSITDTRADGTGAEGDAGTTGVVWCIRGGGNTTQVSVTGFMRATGVKSNRFHFTYWVN